MPSKRSSHQKRNKSLNPKTDRQPRRSSRSAAAGRESRRSSSTSGRWVIGINAVDSALKHRSNDVLVLYHAENREDRRSQKVIEHARSLRVDIAPVTREELDDLTRGGHHQGMAAHLGGTVERNEADLPLTLEAVGGSPLLLVLDGITDPHNFGACLRSAAAAGVHAVVYPRDRAVGITETVSKVSAGAVEVVPLYPVTNLVRTLELLQQQGIWIYGAAGEAQDSLYSLDFRGPAALVLGAEGAGLRQRTRSTCDGLFRIPMSDNVESLNVSVATGISLFEAQRQRLAD